MKATGIVRRIDDLGRVVVPKEIRRTLRLREGGPMEIFTRGDGEIVLKKYSPIGELSAYAKEFADTIAQITGHLVCVSDHDQIVAASPQAQKEYLSKSISNELEELMENRETRVAEEGDNGFIRITKEDAQGYNSQVIQPIISAGDVIGAVAIMNRAAREAVGELEQKIASVAAGFLGRQMEQ